jgi:acetoacetyl-CoA synthetase
MPGAEWFSGATLNYAEHALKGDRNGTAVIEHSQTRGRSELSWEDLRRSVAMVSTALREAGVSAGDTVGVYTDPRPPYGCLGLSLKR